jgi:hypothetical protein
MADATSLAKSEQAKSFAETQLAASQAKVTTLQSQVRTNNGIVNNLTELAASENRSLTPAEQATIDQAKSANAKLVPQLELARDKRDANKEAVAKANTDLTQEQTDKEQPKDTTQSTTTVTAPPTPEPVTTEQTVPDATAVEETGPELLSEEEQANVDREVPPPEAGTGEAEVAALTAGQGVTDIGAARPTSQLAEAKAAETLNAGGAAPLTQTTADTTTLAQTSAAAAQSQLNAGNLDPARALGQTQERAFNPIPNVLDYYASYTYNISLHALTKDQFNQLTEGEQYYPENVLIAGAGRRSSEGDNGKFKRHKYWQQDFYIDNFKMTSVIGHNAQNKGGNVITLDFDIAEPYGISLLDRLILTAKDLKVPNYLQIPYLLQIDFFGYDQFEHEPSNTPIARRLFPIRILSVDITFDTKGALYKCKGVPYSHFAFESEITNLPIASRLQTVEDKSDYKLTDFFGTDEEQVRVLSQSLDVDKKTSDARYEAALEAAIQSARLNGYNPEKGTKEYASLEQTARDSAGYVTDNSGVRKKLTPPIANANGLGSILNSYYKFLAETEKFGKDANGHSIVPYTFAFEFAEPISAANVLNQSFRDFAQTTTKTPDRNKEQTEENIRNGTLQTGSNPGLMVTFQKGTSVLKVIEQLVGVSDYILDQINTDETEQAKKEKSKTLPLNFYKISPKIVLGDYDKKRNDYAKNVTYYIQPCQTWGQRLPFGPQGAPVDADCVKDYNYLFTGKNKDIQNLSINFKSSYFTMYTGGATAKSKDQQRPESQDVAGDEEELALSDGSLFPARIIATNTTDREKLSSTNEKTTKSGDIFNNIFTRQQADMLKVDMTIRGDPAFIQQEDFTICSPQGRVLDDADPRMFKDGSLVVSNGQILVKLTFKFPDDIDTESGLTAFNRELAKTGGSVFSGIYRVLRIDNVFERGLFTQKLDMVRIYNDKQAKPKDENNTSELLRAPGDPVQDTDTGNDLVQLSGPTESDDGQDNTTAAGQTSDQNARDAEEQNSTQNKDDTEPTTDAEAAEQTQQGQDINAAVDQQKANEEDEARIIAEYRTTVTEANAKLSGLSVQISTIDAAQNALKADLAALEASLAASDPEYDNLTEAQIDAKYPEVKSLANKIQAKADERDAVKQEVQIVYNSAYPPPSNKVNSTVSYDNNNVPNITLS